MTLSEYLKKHGIKPTHFAGQIAVRPSTVTRWVRKETIPAREMMKRIEEATKGKVKPNDFYS